MSPAAVVVTLDPEEGVLPDLDEVVPGAGVDELFLVGREERLGDRVIKALSGQSKIGAPGGPDNPS